MRGINKVILVGNLGGDPDCKYVNDTKLGSFSVATNEKWKDKNTGQPVEHTYWHRVCVRGRMAEIAQEYLKKGSKVYVEGKLTNRKYTDNNGVEKFISEVWIDQKGKLVMLDSPNNQSSQSHIQANQSGVSSQLNQQSQPPQNINSGGFDDFDDDLPF